MSNLELMSRGLEAYDHESNVFAHLRPHQFEALDAFQFAAMQMIRGEAPNEGMSIVHPTGSGKTATAGAIVHASLAMPELPAQPSVRALWLAPRLQIVRQTVGSEDKAGAIHKYLPDMDVREYSGLHKDEHGQVTVMTYQSLESAIRSGFIHRMNPGLIYCDEDHHVIDGKWAGLVHAVAGRDTLLVGGTGTPAYSQTQNVSKLFPRELVHKTMRQGIEEGILSNIEGFMYSGAAVIRLTRSGGADYSDEDMFNALAASPDNFLAARICADEVSKGGRGVVGCVPGYDRQHAKIMAQILSDVMVDTPQGRRPMRAAYIGSDLGINEIQDILTRYERGLIDVITQVDYLGEGWDSPATTFMVALRPTKSIVYGEQRIGRLLRWMRGKTARFHEIVFEIVGDRYDESQVTHLDILAEERTKSGLTVRRDSSRKSAQAVPSVDIAGMHLDNELLAQIESIDPTPALTTVIEQREGALPIDWMTSYSIGAKYDLPPSDIDRLYAVGGIIGQVVQQGSTMKTYFPPEAQKLIAEHLKIPMKATDKLSLDELLVKFEPNVPAGHCISVSKTIAKIVEAGFDASLYLTQEFDFIDCYSIAAAEVVPIYEKRRNHNSRVPLPKRFVSSELTTIIPWLDLILVNPQQSHETLNDLDLEQAQNFLLEAVRNVAAAKGRQELPAVKDYEPSGQMQNVMRATGLTLPKLIAAADQARKRLAGLGWNNTFYQEPESWS